MFFTIFCATAQLVGLILLPRDIHVETAVNLMSGRVGSRWEVGEEASLIRYVALGPTTHTLKIDEAFQLNSH